MTRVQLSSGKWLQFDVSPAGRQVCAVTKLSQLTILPPREPYSRHAASAARTASPLAASVGDHVGVWAPGPLSPLSLSTPMDGHDERERSVSASTTAGNSPTSPEPSVMVTPPPPTIRQRRYTARFSESPQASLLLTPPPSMTFDPKPPSPAPATPLPVPSKSSIQSSLHALHADELVYLFKNRTKILGTRRNYGDFVWHTFKDYCYFLWFTWTRAVWNILILPTSQCTPPCHSHESLMTLQQSLTEFPSSHLLSSPLSCSLLSSSGVFSSTCPPSTRCTNG